MFDEFDLSVRGDFAVKFAMFMAVRHKTRADDVAVLFTGQDILAEPLTPKIDGIVFCIVCCRVED